MDPRRQARRELALLVMAVALVARLAEPAPAVLAGGCLFAAVVAGAWAALRDGQPPGPLLDIARDPVRVAPVVLPATSAVAALAAIRIVPVGLWLVVALVATAVLVELTLAVEGRVSARSKGPTPQDRTAALALGLGVSFLGFTGVAALVPDGFVEPGAGAAADQLSEASVVLLAIGDAVLAALLGFRLAALRTARWREAGFAALGYGAAIAVGAGLLRAAALPRFLGPALLTVVLFLWDAVRGSAPAARRDPRFVWQVVLLAVLAVVVVAWNLGLRGAS